MSEHKTSIARSKSTPGSLHAFLDEDDHEPMMRKRGDSLGNIKDNLEALASVADLVPKPPEKVVSLWKAFRDFAFQGSVVDLAVGIIVGGAFGKIVNSLVNDMIMPPIGWLLSGVDFANIFILLKRGKKMRLTHGKYKSLNQAKEDGAVTVNIGVFLNSVLNFVVISMIIFSFVKTIDQLKRKKISPSKKCKYCFSRIDCRAVKCPCCASWLDSQPPPLMRAYSDTIPYNQGGERMIISSDSSYSLNAHSTENGTAVAYNTYPNNDNNLAKEDESDSDTEYTYKNKGTKVLKKQLKKQLYSYGVDLNLLGE